MAKILTPQEVMVLTSEETASLQEFIMEFNENLRDKYVNGRDDVTVCIDHEVPLRLQQPLVDAIRQAGWGLRKYDKDSFQIFVPSDPYR